MKYFLPQISHLAAASALSLLWPAHTLATTGVHSSGGGNIGPQHAVLADGAGRAIAYLDYNGGNATGTLVTSTEAGVLKFLTAAHNVDGNTDGILDGGAADITLFFGDSVGIDPVTQLPGATATYKVVIKSDQVKLNPNWVASQGDASHDMAVFSFEFAQIQAVTGGPSTLQTAAVSAASPLGQEAFLGGHGLFADGTVAIPTPQAPGSPAGASQVDGVLKIAYNTVDYVGLSVGGNPQNKGTIIALDFDKPDGSTSTFGSAGGVPDEGGTAPGDSGSGLFVDSDGDDKPELVGVLNGGYNNFPGGDSAFGDVSEYAPVLTESNLAFLASQNVFVGTSYAGMSAGEFDGVGFSIVDIRAINRFRNGVIVAQQAQSHNMQSVSSHLGNIQTHVNRFNRGTSRLENVGGDEVTLADQAGFGSRRWEFWVGGDLGRADLEPTVNTNGLESQFGAATVGLDFLATSSLIVGMSWSHLYGKSQSNANDLNIESNGNAVGFNISGNWGGLNSSLIHSFASSDTEMSRSFGATQRANASPETSAHNLDWTLSYNFRPKRWVHGPTAGLRYTNGGTDAYSESSSSPIGGLASVSKQDFEAFRINAGYNIAFHIPIDQGKVVPYFGATWIHERTQSDSITASYQGSPFFGIGSGGLLQVGSLPNSTVGGGTSQSSYLNLRGGIELLSDKGLSLNLQGYVNTFREDMIDAGGGLQVGYSF